MMTVGELKKFLKLSEKDETEIRVDNDDDGYYYLDSAEIVTDSKGAQYLNLITSSEV